MAMQRSHVPIFGALESIIMENFGDFEALLADDDESCVSQPAAQEAHSPHLHGASTSPPSAPCTPPVDDESDVEVTADEKSSPAGRCIKRSRAHDEDFVPLAPKRHAVTTEYMAKHFSVDSPSSIKRRLHW
jgi:hypothetical protein